MGKCKMPILGGSATKGIEKIAYAPDVHPGEYCVFADTLYGNYLQDPAITLPEKYSHMISFPLSRNLLLVVVCTSNSVIKFFTLDTKTHEVIQSPTDIQTVSSKSFVYLQDSIKFFKRTNKLYFFIGGQTGGCYLVCFDISNINNVSIKTITQIGTGWWGYCLAFSPIDTDNLLVWHWGASSSDTKKISIINFESDTPTITVTIDSPVISNIYQYGVRLVKLTKNLFVMVGYYNSNYGLYARTITVNDTMDTITLGTNTYLMAAGSSIYTIEVIKIDETRFYINNGKSDGNTSRVFMIQGDGSIVSQSSETLPIRDPSKGLVQDINKEFSLVLVSGSLLTSDGNSPRQLDIFDSLAAYCSPSSLGNMEVAGQISLVDGEYLAAMSYNSINASSPYIYYAAIEPIIYSDDDISGVGMAIKEQE